MFLLDESLFRLWKEGLCDKEEVLMRAAKPAELAAKIAQAERGVFEDEDYEEEDEDAEAYDEDNDSAEDEDEDQDDHRNRTQIRRR
jgi:twitching motility protein PilT